MINASLGNPYPHPANFASSGIASGSSVTQPIPVQEVPDGGHQGGLTTVGMLHRLIDQDESEAVNVLGFTATGPGKRCDIMTFDPEDPRDPLAATVRDFVKDNGCQLRELGLLLAINDDHVVALSLHKDKDDQVSFRYYDPSPSASARDTRKEQVCQRLWQCGIDLERRFTGVRQGRDKRDVNNSGIYAALAMREMMAGRSELNADTEAILAWKRRLDADNGKSPTQGDMTDPFLRPIAKRSSNCNMMAKRFLEQCPAIVFVVDCLRSREATQLQALNKRLYRNIMPSVMQQVSFKDYPVTPGLSLEQVFSSASAMLADAGIPDKLRFGFLGWLLICGTPPYYEISPKSMREYIEHMAERFFDMFNSPQRQQILPPCEWLGEALIDHIRNPHGAARGNAENSQDGSPATCGESRKWVAIVDMFRKSSKLPETLRKAIGEKLDLAVNQRMLSIAARQSVLNNLEPTWCHLADSIASVDYGSLPVTVDGKAERHVQLAVIPNSADGSFVGCKIYDFTDDLIDENKGTRLSDKLRKDVQRHFQKMGWESRLGVSFQQDRSAAPVTPRERCKAYLAAIGEFTDTLTGAQRILLNPAATAADKRKAASTMAAADEAIRHLLVKLLPSLDAGTLARELEDNACPVGFCRLASGLRDAIGHAMAKGSVPTTALLTYRTLLQTCREGLVALVKSGHAKKMPEGGELYAAINAMNAGIDDINARLAMLSGRRQTE